MINILKKCENFHDLTEIIKRMRFCGKIEF